MAKLLTGTRIYGTGTVDTQLFVSGATATSSTNTGALQVVGGAGIGGGLVVGGTVTATTFVGAFSGTVTGAASSVANSVTFNSGGSGDASGTTFNGSAARTISYNTLGAMPTSGGTFSGPVTFSQPVTFSGSATYVLSTNTFYTDNILEMHTPPAGVYTPWFVDDGKDIGFRFHYYTNSTDTNAALVLDNTTKELHWYSSGAESGTGDFSSATFGIFKTGSIKLGSGLSNSGNTTTGDLQVLGGVGVGGGVFVGGTVTATTFVGAMSQVHTAGTGLSGSTYNGSAAVTWTLNTATLMAAAVTATNLAGGSAGQFAYQTGAGATSFVSTGSMYVGRAVTADSVTGGAGSSSQVNTILQTGNASYYPTFVSANNASSTAMSVYTTSSFSINPATGQHNIGILSSSSAGLYISTPAQQLIPTSGYGGAIIIRDTNAAAGNTSFSGINFQSSPGNDFSIGKLNVGGAAFLAFYQSDTPTQLMALDSSGTLLVGTTATQTNGKLQVNGSIGLAPNAQIRQWTNADGGTLQFFGTQVVVGQNNSHSYGYTGGAGLASVSPSGSYVTLDVGGITTGAGHRLQVTNDGTGITGNLYYGIQGGSTATLYANAATRQVVVASGTVLSGAALTVNGGAYVNGILTATTFVGAFSGSITTATNLASGTAGQLHYQSAPGVTSFVSTATTGNFLQANFTGAPTWTSTGSMYVNRAVIADSASGGSAQVNTVAQTASANYYPTFVSTNNASAAAMSVYTTSSFVINPVNGSGGIGNASFGFNTLNTFVTTGTYNFIVNGRPRFNGMMLGNGDGSDTATNRISFDWSSGVEAHIFAQQSVPLLLGTNNTEGMRLTNSNLLGIGTSTVATVIDAYSTSSGIIRVRGGGANNQGGAFYVSKSDGSATLTAYGDYARIGGGTPDQTVSIWTAGGVPLRFDVANAERLRITTNGGFSFGASGTAYGSSGQILQSNGDAAPTWVSPSGLSAGSTGNINATANTNAFEYIVGVSASGSNSAAATVSTTVPFGFNASTGYFGYGTTTPGSVISLSGGTGAALGVAITPAGWNGAQHRLTVPTSGDTSVWSYNYNGSAVDTSTYATSSISVGQQYITFNTGIANTAPSAKMVLSGANVGIGVTSPASVFHVRNGSTFPQGKRGGAASAFFFENATVSDLYLELANTVTNYSGVLFSRAAAGNYGLINYNNATDNMVFYTSGTVQHTITSAGGFAFGTSQTAYGSSGQILQSNGNAPPTWVAPSGLSAGSVANALTINNGGSGSASGTTYNGSSAVTISYNSIGASMASYLTDANLTRQGNSIFSLDSRSTNYAPGDRASGLYADFKANSTDSLVDGGTYHGVLTFRSYGTSNTDFTGGQAQQIATTDNNNLWHRMSSSSSTWGTWYKIIDTGNTGTAYVNRAVIADSASGGSAQVNTVAQTASASYYPTFVSTNNASAAAMSVYTTSSFVINPATGAVTHTGPITVQTDSYGLMYKNAAGSQVAWLSTVFGDVGSGSKTDTKLVAGGTNFGLKVNGGDIASFTSSFAGIGVTSPYTAGSTTTGTLSVAGAIIAGDAQSTNGSVLIANRYGSGLLTVLGSEYSSGGTVLAYGMRPSSTGAAGFNNTYGGGGSLSRSAISQDGNIKFYTAGGAALNIGDTVTISERMRITTNGGIAFGGAGGYGSSGQILQSNGDAAPTWINASSITAGSASLTNTYVGFGSASNTLTGSSSLTWNGTTLYVNGNINAVQGQTASFNASGISTLGSPNQGTYAGYLLLAKAYVSGLQASSFVEGEFVLKRGGTSSGNRTDRYRVSSCSGYNTEGFVVQVTSGSGVGDGFFVGTVKVTYSGTVYHAIKTTVSGGIPDNGVMFFGSSSNAGMIYVDATYISAESSFGNYTFLTSAGNFGLGTTTPSGKLHLYQSAGGSNILTLDTNFASGNAYAINPFITGISNGGLSIRDVTNSVDRLVIQYSTGNVGIGTTSPPNKLTVSNGGAVGLEITPTGGYTTLGGVDFLSYNRSTSAYAAMGFVTNANNNSMVILTNGNVGIGTISPQAPLNTYKAPVASTYVEQIRVGGTSNYASLTFGTYDAYDGYISTLGNDLRILAGKGVATENHSIRFYTSFNGSGGAAENNERLTITSTGAVAFNGASNYGSSGQILQSNGNAAPTWVNASSITAGSASNETLATVTARGATTPTNVSLNGGISAYMNDSGVLFQSYNSSASNAAQFNISHSLGAVTMSNARGALTLNGNVNGSASQLGGLTKSQLWNNSGQNHTTYNSFATPTDFGEWFIHQDSYTDGPSAINVGGSNTGQYYSRSVGLGNDYAYGSYAMQQAIGRGALQPYHWVRSREGGTWQAWTKMAAGYADTAGSSGATSLTSTYVGYGSASNLLTGSSGFTWNGSRLYVLNGVNGWPATSGTTQTASALRLRGADNAIIDFGMNSVNTWIQATDISGLNNNYALHLNPNGGNVGIGLGTASPQKQLTFGPNNDDAIRIIRNTIGGGDPSIGTGITWTWNSQSDNWAAIRAIFPGSGNTHLTFSTTSGSGQTNLAERMRITDTGKIGINSNQNPSYLIDTAPYTGTTTDTDRMRWAPYNGAATGSSGYGATAGGGTNLGTGIVWVPNYSGYTKRSAGILQIAEGNYFRSGLAFYTNNIQDSTTDWTEAMRVGSNGNVSIGQGAAPALLNKFDVYGTNGQLFSVSDSFTGTIFAASDISGIPSIEVIDTGLVKFAQYNGSVAISTGTAVAGSALSVYGIISTIGTASEIRGAGEITAYYSSDERLKENISVISNPIEILSQIRGVFYDWTDEQIARRGGEDGYFVRKHDVGVIAQEVERVLPEVVATREDGYKAVRYEKLVPLLIESIKSQQAEIDTLKYEMNEMKKLFQSLKG